MKRAARWTAQGMQWVRDESGASLVEYVLLVALIAVVAILAIAALGQAAKTKMQETSGVINSAGGS
jgi:pilus assembly protein Flp/PilA